MRKKVNIKEIIPNNQNPRTISKQKFSLLIQSIKDFPEMLEKRPLVVDENMVVLGGNMRLKALQKAGIKEIPIDIAEGWTEKQKKEFIIKDNIGFGEWDWDVLANEWDINALNDWAMDLPPMFDEDTNSYTKKIEAPVYEASEKKPTLNELIDTSNAILSSERQAGVS